MGERTAVRVRITGRVQGVSYRAWVASQAKSRDLHGWVRNRQDGSVEALFVGSRDDVDKMIAACHNGPTLAAVDTVTTEPAKGLTAARVDIQPTV